MKKINLEKVKIIKSYGDSMLPFLKDEDVVEFEKVKFNQIKEGEIIYVKKQKCFFIHRTIYKTKNHLVTKGDNNRYYDGKILSSQILGRVKRIKRAGQYFIPDTIFLIQSTFYLQAILEMVRILKRNKINFLVLKGLPLYLHYLGNYPKKLYADCDFLIDKKQAEAVYSLFVQAGYKSTDSGAMYPINSKNECLPQGFCKIINGFPITFDVHPKAVFLMTQISKLNALYKNSLDMMLTSEFLTHKQTITVKGVKIPVLQPIYLWLYLSLHFFHHNYRGIERLQMVTAVLKKINFSQTKKEIIRLIKTFRLANYLYPSIFFLNKYYTSEKSNKALTLLKKLVNKKKFKYIKENILSKNVFNEEVRFTAGIQRFVHIFFLSDRPLPIKLTIFFYPPIVVMTAWVIFRRVQLFFSSLMKQGSE